MFLVINHNATKYSDKYSFFTGMQESIDYYYSLGANRESYGMKLDLRVGIMNMVDAGETCNAGLIHLKANDKVKTE